MKTSQVSAWTENFGREYTDRNSLSLRDLDVLYEQNYGVGRRKLNERFLAPISCDSRILEVGCNLPNQLALLEEMGYSQLHGVEIQHYALQQAHARLPGVRLVEASAFELPYPDGYFDMIFTSGVLIHIAPGDLRKAMAEIQRFGQHFGNLEEFLVYMLQRLVSTTLNGWTRGSSVLSRTGSKIWATFDRSLCFLLGKN